MPLTTLYNTGTVSVGAGSTTVTGIGTAWNTAGLQAGDDFRASGLTVPIASINSATSITLSRAWPGSALSGANYDIRMVDDGVRSLTASNQLLQALAGGTLTSLGSIAGAANFMPYWTGTGVMGSTALTAAARTLLDDPDTAAMRATLGLVLTTSSTDATAGRVLKVGDFGLGLIGTLQILPDLNSASIPLGWHRANSATANIASRPAGASDAGIVFVERFDVNVVRQSYYDILSPYSTWERRSISGGTWTGWRRRLLDSDITTSATDSTAGRLLKVADFGLGGSMVEFSGNINDPAALPGGFYRVTASATGTKPGVLGAFNLIATRRGAAAPFANASQIAIDDGTGAIYSRGYNETTWTTWKRVDAERGSGPTGEWVRFGDGTQICFGTLNVTDVTTASGAIFANAASETFTFPAAFVSTTGLCVTGSARIGGPYWVNGRAVSNTTGAVRLMSSISASGTYSIEWMAIGRWF